MGEIWQSVADVEIVASQSKPKFGNVEVVVLDLWSYHSGPPV